MWKIVSHCLFLFFTLMIFFLTRTQAGATSIFAAGRVLNSATGKNLVLGAPAALDTGAHLEPALLLSLGTRARAVWGQRWRGHRQPI